MEPEIESKNSQKSKSSASLESKKVTDPDDKHHAFESEPAQNIQQSNVHLISPRLTNSKLYFRSFSHKHHNQINSFQNTFDCIHSNEIFAANFNSQNTTQTTQPILNSAEKTNINKNDNNEFLNSNYLSKSLSTNSTPSKLYRNVNDTFSPLINQNNSKKKALQSNSHSLISTWLHYPNIYYKRTPIATLFTNQCSSDQAPSDQLSDMTLSNPSSQMSQLEECESRRQAVRAPEPQTEASNESLSAATVLAVSSASSTASSSSSPPTFIQNTRLSESTSSSMASSTSPHQNSNQATPTHPQPYVDRFRIKKTLDTDLINSATIISTPVNQDLGQEQVKDDQMANTSTETNSSKSEPVEENSGEQSAKGTERRISKFTVKKVDTTDLLASRLADAESGGLVDDAKKIPDAMQNPVANADPKIIENLTQFQESILMQSGKQEDKTGENKFGDSVNATRSNSIVERNNDLSEISRETDIQEDEKPIDESPDKRFLKYDTEIGHGSFKTVYKGLDTESGVPVAWCELHDRKFNRQERLRFIEEAEMLKQLQHPNIVRFYEYWEDTKVKPKRIILVTELMTSGTLKAYVQRFRTTRLRVIKNFATQILKGLAYLHSRSPPVIHRDLKCDNIFVTGQSGQVKIGDLGLATLKKASFAKSVIGTPEFMAPEMYSEQYDESIDVYAFGMCLLEMATGEYPYQECSKPFEIYKRVTKGQKPDSFSKIDNEDLKELIGWCIRLNRNQRPSVKELLNHSWFMENNGLKLEVLKDKNFKVIENSDEGLITFRLKVYDKARRRGPVWPENEEIEFTFDVNNDDPEQIAKEFKEKTDKICDEDIKFLTQAIKDKIIVFRLDKVPDKNEDEILSMTTSNPSQTANSNETAANQPGLSLIENSMEKAQIFSENQKILNESLAMSSSKNEIAASLSSGQPSVGDKSAVTQNQAPVKQVQFIDQVNEEQSKSGLRDVSLKLTISDFIETVETGEVVHCILELDSKDEIKLKFGLNTDSPIDITKRLLNIGSDVLSNDYANSLTESIQNIIQHINLNKQNLNSIKNKVFNSTLSPLKLPTNAEATSDRKTSATDNLVSLQSINSTNIYALQQNLNQNQIVSQLPQNHQVQNGGSKPQSLVNINHQAAQNMQNQSQIQSTIQQTNNYLDPSKFLVQKQYQVSFEIQSLLNSVDSTGLLNQVGNQPNRNQAQQQQQSAPNHAKVFQSQPMQQIPNPVKVVYANDHVDSGKYQSQSLHQSLLHNALMSQFINNQAYLAANQHNPSNQSFNRNLNNMSPLSLQTLQPSLGPLSAPVIGSNYTLKLSPTSTNSLSGTTQTEAEIKPYPAMVTSHGFNLVPINENPVQNLVQSQQQINTGMVRKSSFNSPSVHLAESAMPEQDISALSLDDPKLIQTVSIQNVLTHKIEHSNDILAQLGERIKQILSEKVLDANQIATEYQMPSFPTANPIHHNPHIQQHLSENVSCYSPSLSRRNSMDLKERKNLTKPIEPVKVQANCEVDASFESAQPNDTNFAFILGLLGVNQLAQQNFYQAKSQPTVPPPNATINRPNQSQSNQQYGNSQPTKQTPSDNFSQIDNQSKMFATIQPSSMNPSTFPHFEDLFMRHRREIEDLLKKHQDELQKYVMESSKKSLNNQQ